MSAILEEILAANARYVQGFGHRGRLAAAPARRFAVLTCMDARLDPAAFAGLGEGDAHVVRNAGGRASDDAIRSLVISHKLLGTGEWFVVHHTGCGMETFTDEIMRRLCAKSLEPAVFGADGWRDVGRGPGSREAEYIDWLTIGDRSRALLDDVRRLRRHPLVPVDLPIHGLIYDVVTGRLWPVEEWAGAEGGLAEEGAPSPA
ncbi:MAG TPA: carbonic anhydrase [Anaeromyxobacter sp.]|nr:carbonic anhydrase [Anaeromyxobacter sp.]